MYEKQADIVAGQAVNSDPAKGFSLKIDTIKSKGNTGGKVPRDVETGIKNLKGCGSTLNQPLLDYFEPRYGDEKRRPTPEERDQLSELEKESTALYKDAWNYYLNQ